MKFMIHGNGHNKKDYVVNLRYIIYCLFTFFISLISQTAGSQTLVDGLIIQADSGERNLDNQTIELNGNIQIVFKGQHLKADTVTVFQKKKELEAKGHVLLTSSQATVGGDRMLLNYETNTGTIYGGFVQAGQVLFEGSLIEKQDDETYLTFDSQYTSCTTCPPAWSFYGRSIDARLGGYAFIKNSILRFGSWPVFWLPYLIVPLKNDRQTGLLTPSFEFSDRGGFSFSQPFFWAISPSQDATITLQNYTIRGLKGRLNHRYLLSQNSGGEMDTGFIRDTYFGQSQRFKTYAQQQTRTDRWFLRYRQLWTLPQNWIFRSEVNEASDLQYPMDFPFETMNNGEPAMENRFSISHNEEHHHFSLDTSFYRNLLHSNPIIKDNDSVHRLPEINFVSTKTPFGDTGFLLNYEFHYLNLYRKGTSYDDLIQGPNSTGGQSREVSHNCQGNGKIYDPTWDQDPSCELMPDGRFDSGTDLIRTGQRLQFEPTLTRPTRLGQYFDFIPRISFRETQYHFGIDNLPALNRRYLRTTLKLQTTFNRVFGDLSVPESTRYKHELEPEMIVTSVPWINQPQHPFFGFSQSTEVPFYSRETVSDSDLDGDNGIQFDYDDRLYDRNLLTYRITNKITQKTVNAQNEASYNRLATWRISQTYDIYEAQRKSESKPWSDVESILSVRLPYFNSYSKINYFPYQEITDTSSHITLNDDNGNYLRLGLTKKFAPSPDSEIDSSQRIEDYLLQMGTTSRYINFAGRIIYNGNDTQAKLDQTRIKALTYAIILRPPGDCWGIHFVQHRDVANNDVTYRLNFDFLFDGKTTRSSPTKLLEDYGF